MHLLHVDKQADKVAHRLAHGAHVLLLGIQHSRLGRRKQPTHHSSALHVGNNQLFHLSPADRGHVNVTHVLEQGLGVDKLRRAKPAVKLAAPSEAERRSSSALKRFVCSLANSVGGSGPAATRPKSFQASFFQLANWSKLVEPYALQDQQVLPPLLQALFYQLLLSRSPLLDRVYFLINATENKVFQKTLAELESRFRRRKAATLWQLTLFHKS